MVIGLMLEEGIATVAVRKRKGKIKSAKRYEFPDSADQNGVLREPQRLGKEMLAAMKKDKIVPTQITVAVQCRDLVVTEVSIPVVSKKLLLQTIRLALQKSFPGILENNYFAYKIYSMQGSQYQIMVALMSREIAQSYYQLAYSMKCKLGRIDIWPNVLAKALKLHYGQKNPDKLLIVDLQDTVSRLYYVENGIIQISNSSSWRSGLGVSGISKETLMGLCRNIEGILSAVLTDQLSEVYLYDRQLLSEDNIKDLTEELNSQFALNLHSFKELTSNVTEQLLKALLWEEKLWSGDLNFALELDISDGRNYSPFEAGVGVLVGLAITALLGNAGYGYYLQNQNGAVQTNITADKNFIEANQDVDALYLSELGLSKEVNYVNAIDWYAEAVHYDFASLETKIEGIVNKHGGVLKEFNVDTNLAVSLNAEADQYSQIADIMQALQNEAGMPVSLDSINPGQKNANGSSSSLEFGLTGTYNLAGELEKTEKGNSVNGTGGNQ